MRHRTIPEGSEFGYLPFTPSLLFHYRIPQLPPWCCGPKGTTYCSSRNIPHAPKDLSIWSNGNFAYLENGDWEITREQLKTVVDICTLGLSSLDLRVLSLLWAPGEVLYCHFILFCFVFTNKEVCQCLSKRSFQMGASHWTPHSSTATGVRHSLSF